MSAQYGSKVWLFLGGSCIVVTCMLWMFQTGNHINRSAIQKEKEEDVIRVIQPETVTNTRNLGMFEKEVTPLDMTKRVAQSGGVHGAQFRGSKFVADNQNRWTLELMKVGDEDIIRTYLQKRDDRSIFNYLRLQDGKNPEQYVLTYGVFNSAQDATAKMQQVQFSLPSSIKVIPVKISTYVPLVNDLGSDENSSGLLRTVKLQKTVIRRIEPKVEQPKERDDLIDGKQNSSPSTIGKDTESNSTPKDSSTRPEKAPRTEKIEETRNDSSGKEEKKPVVSKQWSGSGQVDDPF